MNPELIERLLAEVVNEVTAETVNVVAPQTKRQKLVFTAAQRFEIGEFAATHGAAKAQKEFFGRYGYEIGHSTVTKFKNQFKSAKEKKELLGRSPLKDLPAGKAGRPCALGNWDAAVCSVVKNHRLAGSIINRSIVIGIAKGIVKKLDPSKLVENGGHLTFSRAWAYSLLRRMKYVKRKGTKAAKKLPVDFPQIRDVFLERVSDTVNEFSIPKELCVNMDETGAKYIPVSDWTMEEEGAAQVPLPGLDDKREMTVVLSISAAGKLLPPQLIYQGKTAECHAKNVRFPATWNVTHTDSHWSTEVSIELYIKSILVPYFNNQKQLLGLPDNQKCLLLWDVYAPHRTEHILKVLQENNILVIFVPACCTSELQPLDLSVNAIFKRKQKEQFTEWYADEIGKQIENGVLYTDVRVDFPLSFVKPQHAKWVIDTIQFLNRKSEIISKGFQMAGLLSCFGEPPRVHEEQNGPFFSDSSDEEENMGILEFLARRSL